MISKSIMVDMANCVGGNAVAVIDGIVTVANITAGGTSVVGYYAAQRAALVINQPDTFSTNPHDADADDAELLGSRALAAGGRALAKRADADVALVKGSGGWVGVRA